MNKIILTQAEIEAITGRQRFRAQVRQLARMGIECKVNAVGAPIVSRSHFEQSMGCVAQQDSDIVELNLDFTKRS